VSQVLQWNTNVPDFNAASNSSRVNLTVWLWFFGQTISNASRLCISSPSCSGVELPLLLNQWCQFLMVARTIHAGAKEISGQLCAPAGSQIEEGSGVGDLVQPDRPMSLMITAPSQTSQSDEE